MTIKVQWSVQFAVWRSQKTYQESFLLWVANNLFQGSQDSPRGAKKFFRESQNSPRETNS